MLNCESYPFGIDKLDPYIAYLTIQAIEQYLINQCGPEFTSLTSSLELLGHINNTGLVRRMIQIELENSHQPFSHALQVADIAKDYSHKINILAKMANIGTVIDEPITVEAAFLHDMGKIITPADITSYQLEQIGLQEYILPYPPDRPKLTVFDSHILRTIALIKSFGQKFDPIADAAAHAISHLTRDSNITLERLIVNLSDYSVIDDDSLSWPKSRPVKSFEEKLAYVSSKYGEDYKDYEKQYQILLQTFEQLFRAGIRSGISVLPELSPQQANEKINPFLSFLSLNQVKIDNYKSSIQSDFAEN